MQKSWFRAAVLSMNCKQNRGQWIAIRFDRDSQLTWHVSAIRFPIGKLYRVSRRYITFDFKTSICLPARLLRRPSVMPMAGKQNSLSRRGCRTDIKEPSEKKLSQPCWINSLPILQPSLRDLHSLNLRRRSRKFLGTGRRKRSSALKSGRLRGKGENNCRLVEGLFS